MIAAHRARRPHVIEVDYWFRLTDADPFEWSLARSQLQLARDRVRGDTCKAVITMTPALAEHFRRVLGPEVWPKIDYAYPAFPAQPDVKRLRNGTFTLLTIGNRLSDKGIPEALRAFEILRGRHGAAVRMVLVSKALPAGYRVPEGSPCTISRA